MFFLNSNKKLLYVYICCARPNGRTARHIINIWAPLKRSQCKISATQVTVKACGPLVFSHTWNPKTITSASKYVERGEKEEKEEEGSQMVTPAYKNRRSEMKIKRHMKSSTLERREGVKYQTGDDVTEFPSHPFSSYTYVTTTFTIRWLHPSLFWSGNNWLSCMYVCSAWYHWCSVPVYMH